MEIMIARMAAMKATKLVRILKRIAKQTNGDAILRGFALKTRTNATALTIVATIVTRRIVGFRQLARIIKSHSINIKF